MGPEVYAAWRALKAARADRTMKAVVAQYPASNVSTLWPSPERYFRGLRAGVRDVEATLLSRAAAGCTRERLVLAGYSQGAMVMHRVLHDISDAAAHTALARLRPRVDGAILIGDGDRVAQDHTRMRGGAPDAARGVGTFFPRLSETVRRKLPDDLGDRTYSICRRHDPVCDALAPIVWIDVHFRYSRDQLVSAAAQSVARRLRRTPATSQGSLQSVGRLHGPAGSHTYANLSPCPAPAPGNHVALRTQTTSQTPGMPEFIDVTRVSGLTVAVGSSVYDPTGIIDTTWSCYEGQAGTPMAAWRLTQTYPRVQFSVDGPPVQVETTGSPTPGGSMTVSDAGGCRYLSGLGGAVLIHMNAWTATGDVNLQTATQVVEVNGRWAPVTFTVPNTAFDGVTFTVSCRGGSDPSLPLYQNYAGGSLARHW
jgi:hypothetical protein